MNASPLISLDEALSRVLGAVRPPETRESLALAEALGRILAQDFYATLDVPPADNSAMDGYALASSLAGQIVPVESTVFAGDVPTAVSESASARVFTGAEIPDGADAVVIQEDVELCGDRVRMPEDILAGQHIRRRGQDCRRGELLLAAGRRLVPQDLGLIASQGIAEVSVFGSLKVALLSTGKELREPGSGDLPRAAIFNSNRPMLQGLLRKLGCEVLDFGIVDDTPQATEQALSSAADQADVIISSGGVSVGEADHVRDAVEKLGAIDLWRIAIKPGKPFAFGSVRKRAGSAAQFIGLPGNPTSAFVTFLLLARPFVLALQGCTDVRPSRVPGIADFTVKRAGTREEFLRVRTELQEGRLLATPYTNQSSGVLRSVTESNALAIVPRGQTIARGDSIELLMLDTLLV
ncbi:MAG: molybdopterin molybdotransferase MoeA [Congregibacter sp.]